MAYRAYRAETFHTFLHLEWPFRKLRDAVLYIFGNRYPKEDNRELEAVQQDRPPSYLCFGEERHFCAGSAQHGRTAARRVQDQTAVAAARLERNDVLAAATSARCRKVGGPTLLEQRGCHYRRPRHRARARR
jgi:hypothetical protein